MVRPGASSRVEAVKVRRRTAWLDVLSFGTAVEVWHGKTEHGVFRLGTAVKAGRVRVRRSNVGRSSYGAAWRGWVRRR
jgi:hypothetical protein